MYSTYWWRKFFSFLYAKIGRTILTTCFICLLFLGWLLSNHQKTLTMFFRFLAKIKAQTWSSTWAEIQISRVSKAFNVKNHPYFAVSNTSQDCWYVVSHVSFASSNYESRVWSRFCFDFRQKPEKHGIRCLTQKHLSDVDFQLVQAGGLTCRRDKWLLLPYWYKNWIVGTLKYALIVLLISR